MKRFKFSLLFILTVILFNCSSDDDLIIGSGMSTTQVREIPEFNKISNIGVIDLNIAIGEAEHIEVTADNNIIGFVKTEVNNNKLKIHLDDDYNFNNINVSVSIMVPELKAISNRGTGRIDADGINNQEGFEVFNEGTGRMSLSGNTNNLSIKIEGSGDISAFELYSTNCNTEIIGSGDLEISCSEELDVILEGSGNVFYKGNPVVHSNIDGSGEVIDSN